MISLTFASMSAMTLTSCVVKVGMKNPVSEQV